MSLSKAKTGSDATEETCAIMPADLVLRVGLMLPLTACLAPSFSPYTFYLSKYCSFLLGFHKARRPPLIYLSLLNTLMHIRLCILISMSAPGTSQIERSLKQGAGV